jgi:hypothetical protein
VFDTYGATSLFTTPRDLLTWMAQLDKPSVTSANLVAQMETPAALTDGTSTNYGFGLSVGRYRGLRVVGHSGADAGYRAHAERYPDHGVAVVVLCNASNTNPGNLARRIADVVLGSSMQPLAAAVDTTKASISPDVRNRWVGTYRDRVSRLILRVQLAGDTLTLGDGRRLTPSSDTTAFAPGGNQQFALQLADDGVVRGIALTPRGTRAVFFTREPSFTPGPAALRVFAGEYRSDELSITYQIAVTDTGLVMRERRSPDIKLEPTIPDAFAMVPFGSVLEFTRSGGRISGFFLSDGRMRRVRFVRITR